jgi:hypothetical protein
LNHWHSFPKGAADETMDKKGTSKQPTPVDGQTNTTSAGAAAAKGDQKRRMVNCEDKAGRVIFSRCHKPDECTSCYEIYTKPGPCSETGVLVLCNKRLPGSDRDVCDACRKVNDAAVQANPPPETLEPDF